MFEKPVYTFTCKTTDGLEVTMKTKSLTRYDLLKEFVNFLQACGFSFTQEDLEAYGCE